MEYTVEFPRKLQATYSNSFKNFEIVGSIYWPKKLLGFGKRQHLYIRYHNDHYAVLPSLNVPKLNTPWAAIGSVVYMILHFWNQCMQSATLSQLYNREHPVSRHILCVSLWGLWAHLMGWSLVGIRYAGDGSNLRSRWKDLATVTVYYGTMTNKCIAHNRV